MEGGGRCRSNQDRRAVRVWGCAKAQESTMRVYFENADEQRAVDEDDAVVVWRVRGGRLWGEFG